jgi:hypothetical protein
MTYDHRSALGAENLERIFRALDRQIAACGGCPIGLVICGGSALAALGLTSRTTGDADVLGQAVQADGRLGVARMAAFPEWLKAAAAAVARDFSLDEHWLNLGPAELMDAGLPAGLESRLQKAGYGQLLTVFYISRIDQIHFKLYAAVDRGPGDYHVDDLLALRPTAEEMTLAARWVAIQDAAPAFRLLLRDFLGKNGYADVATGL